MNIVDTFTGLLPPGLIWANKYIIAVLVLALSVLIAKSVQILFTRYIIKITVKTKTGIDDILVSHVNKPVFYLILAYGLKLSLRTLEVNGLLGKTVDSVMALVFLLLILRVIDIALEVWSTTLARKTKTTFDNVLLPLFHKVTKVVFVLVGFLWILKIWEINIAPYLAGVGISGLVLGLALQDSLKNVFGGISMILDKNFSLGDAVKLESGELGVIKSIGLRSTVMLTYDNEVIFIPNGQLANMKIHNFMRPNTRIRKIVDFSVEYGTDPEEVKKVVLAALQKIKDIYDDPYMDVIFVQMGDSGLHFKARFWADWSNAYTKWVEATQAIYAALNKAGIGIPFPTRTVYLKK